jgi:hypothetical protein
MYWTITDKKYVIQATNNVVVDKEIPIGIVSAGGDITIKIDSLENITDNLKVYLKDKDLNTLYDLSTSDYRTFLPSGEYLNKYAITFKESGALNIQDQILKNNMVVFMDNLNKSIKIKNLQLTTIKKVILFNTLGQKVKMWNSNLANSDLQLNVNVSPGLYFVEVLTNNAKATKKIIIN